MSNDIERGRFEAWFSTQSIRKEFKEICFVAWRARSPIASADISKRLRDFRADNCVSADPICVEAAAYIDELEARAALDAPKQEPVAWWDKAIGAFYMTYRSIPEYAIRTLAITPLYIAPPAAQVLSDEEIHDIFIANGFTIKDGQTDLKPYVYAAARALLAKAAK